MHVFKLYDSWHRVKNNDGSGGGGVGMEVSKWVSEWVLNYVRSVAGVLFRTGRINTYNNIILVLCALKTHFLPFCRVASVM